MSAVAIVGLGSLMVLMTITNRRLRHEVGERATAEAAQRDSEARYQAVFAHAADLLSREIRPVFDPEDFAACDPEGNRWSFGTYRGEPRKEG